MSGKDGTHFDLGNVKFGLRHYEEAKALFSIVFDEDKCSRLPRSFTIALIAASAALTVSWLQGSLGAASGQDFRAGGVAVFSATG